MAQFNGVWYRSSENQNVVALKNMQDRGTLSIDGAELVFAGKKEQVRIADIHHIELGYQGVDRTQKWVIVSYGAGQTAYLKDGRLLGWAGILGGTKKMCDVINASVARR